MKNERLILVLKALIKVNVDRIAGYENVILETEEGDLKFLFSESIQTSLNCKSELVNSIHKMDGTPNPESPSVGIFSNNWKELKVAIRTKDRKLIIDICETAENAVLEIYQNALSQKQINWEEEQKSMVMAHFALLTADCVKLKTVRELVLQA